MAELLSSLSGRFACRQFTSQTLADAQLGLILEAGRIAPSAFGIEPWRFISVRSATAKEKVASACFNQPPAATAPVLIAIVALVGATVPGSAFAEARLKAEAGDMPLDELREMYRGFYVQIEPRNWAIAQCNFAAAQMMVQATAMGLASCPMGGFEEPALAAALGLDQDEVPALVMAIGNCVHAQGERRRRGMDEILSVL